MQYFSRWVIPHWTGYYVVNVNPQGGVTELQREATTKALFLLLHEFRSGDAKARSAMREIYDALSPAAVSRFSHVGNELRDSEGARVAAFIERAAVLGQLSIVPDQRPLTFVLQTPEVLPPAATEPAPKPEPLHYIEIELRDEDNNALAGEAYRLKLPDGREVSGKLDASGRARVADIAAAGKSQLSFPNLEARARA